MVKKIRVLVVDDSKLMRKFLSDIINQDELLTVVGTARSGADALRLIPDLNPDVITLDIEMPHMDGLTALQHIMEEQPVPVVMVSAMDKRERDITIKALELGAVDFVSKTSGTLSLDIEKTSQVLVTTLKTAAMSKVERTPVHAIDPIAFREFLKTDGNWAVVIGASTGGPKAIPAVLSLLPQNIPAVILVVQHMPEGFTHSFAERLNWCTSLEVREAKEGDDLRPGTVLVAPGNHHMEVRKGGIHITEDPKVNGVRPSVDITMRSISKSFQGNTIGVILTGMGNDGVDGLRAIKKAGGRTLAQDEASSVVFGMPKAAIDMRVIDDVVPLEQIAERILKEMEGN